MLSAAFVVEGEKLAFAAIANTHFDFDWFWVPSGTRNCSSGYGKLKRNARASFDLVDFDHSFVALRHCRDD